MNYLITSIHQIHGFQIETIKDSSELAGIRKINPIRVEFENVVI